MKQYTAEELQTIYTALKAHKLTTKLAANNKTSLPYLMQHVFSIRPAGEQKTEIIEQGLKMLKEVNADNQAQILIDLLSKVKHGRATRKNKL